MAAAFEEVALRSMLQHKAPPGTGQDHAGQIDRAIGDVARRLGEYGGAVTQRLSRRFDAVRAYCSGDPNRFVTFSEQSESPRELFPAHLTAGRIEPAEKCLAQTSDKEAGSHLLLYLAASRAGEKGVADRHLRAACELLAKGDWESRQYGKALAGEAALPLPHLLRLRMSPQEKLVLVTALGVRDPASREPCFALARKLNFDPRFPHLLIADVLSNADSINSRRSPPG
jgi:hypothetical protein